MDYTRRPLESLADLRARWTARIGQRGLTMIELLTVVALLGLIIAVMVAFLFPSDDRRVKQEAERLAAYCEAAGGEAKMAEGAVRVALAFDDGEYKREHARIGARITDLAWQEDERAKVEHVRAPVKLTAVEIGDAGTLESGTAWLVWEDTKTRGGVAVLQLNEAIYSVVVEPATGQVRVEKGRATLPASGKPLKRTFVSPDFAALTDGTTISPEALQGIFNNAPTTMPPTPVPETPPAPVGGTPAPAEQPQEPAVAPEEPPPYVPPPEPFEPPTEPPTAPPLDASVPQGDAQPTPPEPNEDPCQGYSCPPQHGMPQMCVTRPGDDGNQTPRCVADPRGRAYLGTNYALGGDLSDLPEADVAEQYIETLLRNNGYKFLLVFPPQAQSRRSRFDPLMFPMHMVQGAWQVSGDVYGGRPGVTNATRAIATLDAPEENVDAENALSVWYIFPSAGATSVVQTGENLRSQQGEFILTLPLYDANDERCFWRMSTVVGVTAVAVPVRGRDAHKMIARLDTCLGGRNANVKVDRNTTLREVLEELANPLCDTNGDGVADGWPVTITVEMVPVNFADDPGPYQGAPVEPACNR